jgi:hypothetical protein
MNQEEMLGEYQQECQLEREIANALESLNEKERYTVEQRILNDSPLTLQDIAGHFGISRERVRQIEERALAKLRQILSPIILEISLPLQPAVPLHKKARQKRAFLSIASHSNLVHVTTQSDNHTLFPAKTPYTASGRLLFSALQPCE